MTNGKTPRPALAKQPPEQEQEQEPPPVSLPLGYYDYYGIPRPETVQAKLHPCLTPGRLAYYGIAVQAKTAGQAAQSGPEETVHEAAARGTSGAGTALPYLDPIQRAFGPHDVSQVKAHTGHAATEAARAMGAEAYASGDHVAFAGAPSLHTAAHEAAHVIQQRAGVQLKGGVGEVGDAYERQADQVADRVVQGLSAEALLDQMGSSGQRQPGERNTDALLAGATRSKMVQQRSQQNKKAAPPPVIFEVDAQGGVVTSGAAHEKVGFKVGQDAWIAVQGKKQGVSLVAAKIGVLRVAKVREIFEMRQVELQPVAEEPSKDTSSNSTAEPATNPPAADPVNKRYTARFTGRRGGLVDDGTIILDRGKSWEPVEAIALAGALGVKLDESSRIELDDGSLWVWMSFALKDEVTDTARWVPPGHSRSEVAGRQRELTAEAERLPSAAAVRGAIDAYIRTISLVSTVEGSFGAVSPADDTYASLGIFQWAMPKDESKEAGSLGHFFGGLKERAGNAQAKVEKERTEEDKLYIAAWAQCMAHRLDVMGDQILLNGKPATGGQVESTMHDEMTKGNLRTYQLVAARDWIEQFKSTIIRPGPVGSGLIGHHYVEQRGGATITLRLGKDSLVLDGDAYATVGSLFATDHAIATAVMLGVNRPHYVETALWRALVPIAAPQARVEELLVALVAALTPNADANAKPRTYRTADIVAAGAEAQTTYAELKSLLWPTAALDSVAQAKLETEFKKQALKLYQPADARKYHREQRFSTVEAATW